MRSICSAGLCGMPLIFLVFAGCDDDGTKPKGNDNETPPDNVWFVDVDAAGTNDGTSWENAFAHPQDAVKVSHRDTQYALRSY